MCLQNVVRRMAAPGMRKTLDLWADNIGKNVSHHSGWLANCLKLHVIEKVADNARGSGVLVLGKDRGRYKLLPYNDKLFGDAFKRNEQLGSILQNMPTPKLDRRRQLQVCLEVIGVSLAMDVAISYDSPDTHARHPCHEHRQIVSVF